MIRSVTLALLVVPAALALSAAAGCGGDDEAEPAAAPGGDTAVTIKTFMYEPDPLEVDAGTSVTFTNEDDILHTVTAGTRDDPAGGFDEELDGAGTTAEVTFDEAGMIDYFCSIHEGMDGQVIVA